jgi:hypothetical protein
MISCSCRCFSVGVLIGPLGLFLLRRMLKRIGAVGAALARLARWRYKAGSRCGGGAAQG